MAVRQDYARSRYLPEESDGVSRYTAIQPLFARKM